MKKEIKINFKLLAYKVINVVFYLFVCALLWIAIFNPALSRFVSIEEIYVPDVRGEYESDALTILHKSGFSVKIEYIPYDKEVEPYTVFSMFPRAYTKVKKNRVIEIVVYKDKEKIKIPNYTGLDIRDTRSRIKRDGFLIKEQNIFYYFDEADPINIITRQLPKAGDFIEQDSDISLWVSSGAPPNEYIVPTIIGKSFKEARKELNKNGFAIGEVDYIENNEYLENTVYNLSYISNNGYKIEVIEGIKYTVPITINITLTKYGE